LQFEQHTWKELIRKIKRSSSYRESFLSMEIENVQFSLSAPIDVMNLYYLPHVQLLNFDCNLPRRHKESFISSSSGDIIPIVSLPHLESLELSHCSINDQVLRISLIVLYYIVY
jgi:hypothetical protein